MSYHRVVDSCDAVVVLLGDHERSQVGRVAGGEHDREQSPDTGHEATGHAPRIVDTDSGAEQHRPDEPERTEQRKLVLCNEHTCMQTADALLRPPIPCYH